MEEGVEGREGIGEEGAWSSRRRPLGPNDYMYIQVVYTYVHCTYIMYIL